ncbi:hypothetical protein PINS_up000813 [Pythium insidiosum]|nr:hypothetical protein PINS_up000813 [Pythium insidiosum]
MDSNTASDGRSASDDAPPGADVGTDTATAGAAGHARKTPVELFLELRGLSKSAPAPAPAPEKTSPQRPGSFRPAKPSTAVAVEPQRPRPLWSSFTKRGHGNRVDFLRRALRIPDEDYSESKDAYTRRKKAKTFIALHVDADIISRDFLHEMRHLFFEREIVDRPVCDLHENRTLYIERLKHAYSDGEEAEDKGDDTIAHPTPLVV